MAFRSRQHSFAEVPSVGLQRSRFDRSHTHTTTFDSGYLIPFYVDEVLPGDTFDISCSLFGRLLTPVVPFMDNLYLDTQFFFVPNRLIFDHWVNLMGEQKNPGDSTDYILPSITAPAVGGFAVGSIFDYMGLPTGIASLKVPNALPLRAYNKIWNDWYRDENLQNSVAENVDDGPDSPSDYTLLRRGKRHDYFTSCLPWPQKGDAVDLPLGLTAPVVGTGQTLGLTNGTASGGIYGVSQSVTTDANSLGKDVGYSGARTGLAGGNLQLGVVTDPDNSGLVADLSQATAATINSLREAFQLQRLLEASARGGTRYTEILRSIFKVDSGDARLQRSEYLGGSSTMVNVNSVQQTSSTDNTSPQGNLAAFATMGDSQKICTKSFVEHGWIIGLCSVRADLHYQQGMNRFWNRSTRWDFYYPQLAHLGEQAVLNKEIFAQGPGVVDADGVEVDEKVFGYQERYAEYRYYPSMITGKMRSTDPQSLDVWHLAQEFQNLPTLSSTFIEENPPLDRVLAVQNEPQIKLDSLISLICTRPMPVYSVPGLIDHF